MLRIPRALPDEAQQAVEPPKPAPDYTLGSVLNRHFDVEFHAARRLLPVEAALLFFRHPALYRASGGTYPLTRKDWFWAVVSMLWGPESGAKKVFLKHPWAEQMAEACSAEKYVAMSGCASSGKSDFMAMWAIVNFISEPEACKCFVTSTSLKEAKGRVWGSIHDYWNGCVISLPGKVIDSEGLIRPIAAQGEKPSQRSGIELIAGAPSKEKDALGKLIGFKQKRVIMLADELSELSPAILEACYGNLVSNVDMTFTFRDTKTLADDGKSPRFWRSPLSGFQLIAASNFKSFVDPFGVFSTPKTSWRDVTVETTSWRMANGGLALRFSGLKSPNFDQDYDKWPIYGRKLLAQHDTQGRNSSTFWRFCHSFPAPMGVEDVVYSQQELLQGGAFDRVVWSDKRAVRLAALDPSFTSGGDRCMVHIGTLGWTTDGKRVLQLDETHHLREDVTDSRPFDRQILDQYKAICVSRGISRECAAFDATGAGISFGTLITEVWGEGLLAVKFGGAASKRMCASGETLKEADKLYANRVSELWFQGKEFLRSEQLKGVTVSLGDEMCQRKFKLQKGAETRMQVMPKGEMKAEGLKSPDEADAYFILIELAIARFDFLPEGMEGSARKKEQEESPALQYDSVYQDEIGSFE